MQTRSLALPETARHFLIIIERHLFVSDWISISNIRKYTRQMLSIIKANIINHSFFAVIWRLLSWDTITHAHLLKNLPTCKLRKTSTNTYSSLSDSSPSLSKVCQQRQRPEIVWKTHHGRATQAQTRDKIVHAEELSAYFEQNSLYIFEV